MNIKLKTFLLAITLIVTLVSTGCNSTVTEEGATPSTLDDTQGSASGNADSQEIEDGKFIDSSIELLGMTHDASATYFTSSEELYSADGKFLIGRSYSVNAFGVNTTLFTSVNTESIINSISVHLGEDNFEMIRDAIENQLGPPKETQDTPSEGGNTNVMWEIDGKLIYLYNGYGAVDLQLILPDIPTVPVVDADFVSQLPSAIEPVLAEIEPYPALRDFIINSFDIPEEYHAKTKYYYNFVDLNSDGRAEIFAVVMGSYTSGTGGSSALIAFDFEGEIRPITKMTLIHTPVVISETSTKRMKDIIVMKRGGGAEASFVKLTSTGEGHYTSVNLGEKLESLQDLEGQLIIANDIMHDIENNLFLTLE